MVDLPIDELLDLAKQVETFDSLQHDRTAPGKAMNVQFGGERTSSPIAFRNVDVR
jgi:hypothetical protein